MKFNNTILAIEIENLHRRENEMYVFYSELLKDLKNEEIKNKIKIIRDQEKNHIEMVTKIISILSEHIVKG
jgi:rubrerythrin